MAELADYIRYGDDLLEQVGATESLAPTLKRIVLTYTGGVGRKLKGLITTSKHLTSEFDAFTKTNADRIAAFKGSPLPIPDGVMPVPKGMSGTYGATIQGILDGFTLLGLKQTFADVLTLLDHLERDLKSNTSSSLIITKYTTELEKLKKIAYMSEEVIAAQRKLFGNAYSHPRPIKSVITSRQDFSGCLADLTTLSRIDHLGELRAQLTTIETVAGRVVDELEQREHYRKTVATLIQKLYVIVIAATDAYAILLHNAALLTHAFVVGSEAMLRADQN